MVDGGRWMEGGLWREEYRGMEGVWKDGVGREVDGRSMKEGE